MQRGSVARMPTVLLSGCMIKAKRMVAEECRKIWRAFFFSSKYRSHENDFRGEAEVEYGGNRKKKKMEEKERSC